MAELSNEELIEKLKKGEDVPADKKRAFPKLKLKMLGWKSLGLLVLLVALLALANHFYRTSGMYTVSANRIQWHAHLDITIKGRKEAIPAGIGLVSLNDHPDTLHTHETDNIIHMEIPESVKARQIMLARFFEQWQKQEGESGAYFDDKCIFTYCDGRDGSLHFLVNGRLNYDYQHYVMHDGDKIEILFE